MLRRLKLSESWPLSFEALCTRLSGPFDLLSNSLSWETWPYTVHSAVFFTLLGTKKFREIFGHNLNLFLKFEMIFLSNFNHFVISRKIDKKIISNFKNRFKLWPKKYEIRVIVKILTKNLQKKIHENKNYKNNKKQDWKYFQSISAISMWTILTMRSRLTIWTRQTVWLIT